MELTTKKLCYLLQKEIATKALENGYAILKDPTKGFTFSNLKFLKKYYNETGQVHVSKEDYEYLRDLPWSFKSTKALVIKKLQDLLQNQGVKIEEIKEAAELYLSIREEQGRKTRSLSNWLSNTQKDKVVTNEVLTWIKASKEEVELETIA